jgi:TonB family protein
MKLKIFLIMVFCISVGFAQQKDKKKTKDENPKEYVDLKKHPEPLTQIKPVYPETLKLAGVQGKVFIETLVDEKGNVVETKVLKTENEALCQPAIDAIKKTKFSPAISKENKKVKSWVVIPIAFKLEEKKDGGISENNNLEESDPDINAFIAVEKYPEVKESGEPVYPEEAKKNGIEGKVFVKVLIDKNGSAKKAVILKSDNEIFNNAAIDAAKSSKFSPAMQKGKPIAVWVVLPYRFDLGTPKSETIKLETLDAAKTYFRGFIDSYLNPSKRIIIEKISGSISYGDESSLYKMTKDNKTFYNFIARIGNNIFKYTNASGIEEIKESIKKIK